MHGRIATIMPLMPASPLAGPHSSSSNMIEFGHLTHVGLRRELNEDTYYGDSELGLWLVADGMGGHEYGEVASALARETIVREVRDGTPLAQAIRIADEEIIRASRRRNDALPMGTTVVAARVSRQPLRSGLGRRQPRLPVARGPAGAVVAGPQLRAGADRPGRDHRRAGAQPSAPQRGDAGAGRDRPEPAQRRNHDRRTAPGHAAAAVQRRPDRGSRRPQHRRRARRTTTAARRNAWTRWWPRRWMAAVRTTSPWCWCAATEITGLQGGRCPPLRNAVRPSTASSGASSSSNTSHTAAPAFLRSTASRASCAARSSAVDRDARTRAADWRRTARPPRAPASSAAAKPISPWPEVSAR